MDNIRSHKDDIKKFIGNECRNKRIYAGLSLLDVAKMTGYSRSNISMFENGHSDNMVLYHFYLGGFNNEC